MPVLESEIDHVPQYPGLKIPELVEVRGVYRVYRIGYFANTHPDSVKLFESSAFNLDWLMLPDGPCFEYCVVTLAKDGVGALIVSMRVAGASAAEIDGLVRQFHTGLKEQMAKISIDPRDVKTRWELANTDIGELEAIGNRWVAEGCPNIGELDRIVPYADQK